MKILVKEINYKEIEVPNDITRFDVENMIQNCEVVIGDTTDTEYEVKISRKRKLGRSILKERKYLIF